MTINCLILSSIHSPPSGLHTIMLWQLTHKVQPLQSKYKGDLLFFLYLAQLPLGTNPKEFPDVIFVFEFKGFKISDQAEELGGGQKVIGQSNVESYYVRRWLIGRIFHYIQMKKYTYNSARYRFQSTGKVKHTFILLCSLTTDRIHQMLFLLVVQHVCACVLLFTRMKGQIKHTAGYIQNFCVCVCLQRRILIYMLK